MITITQYKTSQEPKEKLTSSITKRNTWKQKAKNTTKIKG